MKSRNRAIRMTPSTRLKMICSPNTGFTRFSSVAASSGRNLYMKMKKPTEMMMLTAAIQPVISSFFLLRRGLGLQFIERNVGGKFQRPEAQGHGMTERDHTSNDGPRHPFAFFGQPLQRFAVGGHFAGRLAAGDGPSVRRAHHNALKHGLAADQSLLAAFKCGQELHGHQETPPGSQKTHMC